MFIKAIVVFALLLNLQLASCERFCYGFGGTLTCRGEPYADGFVALWERDSNLCFFGWCLDSDDLIQTKRMDEDGSFHVYGCDTENYIIQPFLKIYHRCNIESVKPGYYQVEHLKERKIKKDSFEDLGTLELKDYQELYKGTDVQALTSKLDSDIPEIKEIVEREKQREFWAGILETDSK